jgi:hypothetical protein
VRRDWRLAAGVSLAAAVACLATGLGRQNMLVIAIGAALFALSVGSVACAANQRESSRLAAPIGLSRSTRVRQRDLPSGTYVRDAVVLACPIRSEGDAAVRFAVREAQLRGARLVVMTSYMIPVDPDLESIETPDAELRRWARTRAAVTLCRSLGRAAAQLPDHNIVTESGPATVVLLRSYADAQLIVAAVTHRGLLARFGARDADGATLVRRSRAPVALVPGGPPVLNGSHERLP